MPRQRYMFHYRSNDELIIGTCQRVEEGDLVNFYVTGFEDSASHLTKQQREAIKEMMYQMDFTTTVAHKGATLRVGPKYLPTLTLAPCPYYRSPRRSD